MLLAVMMLRQVGMRWVLLCAMGNGPGWQR